MDICPSCCQSCTAEGTNPKKYSNEDPYAITETLIPAGVFILHRDPDQQEVACNHVHLDDGWHPFDWNVFSQHILLDGVWTLDRGHEIAWLIRHHFVSITYRLGPSLVVFLRVYIIPYDLKSAHGKLLNRPAKIFNKARPYMKNLLPCIFQNDSRWFGTGISGPLSVLVPTMKEHRTLSEIYGDLKSPQPKMTSGLEDTTKRMLDFEDELEGFGMRSSLYRYQRRSVAAMIQKELDLGSIPDPLFIPLSSMKKECFYLQPGTMEVLRGRPMVAPCRNGILCEELGTGKTVMILSLILATINQISSPEESIVDDRPVMTPLSFRHFPSSVCATTRNRLLKGRKDEAFASAQRVPSLVEILLDRGRTSPDTSIPYTKNPRRSEIASHVEQIRPGDLLRANAPFYYHYHGEPASNERSQRTDGNTGPRVVYLTSATLIVVPPNLLSQWEREIQKHCEYPLRVLTLRSGTPMPPVISLASDYHIVLMTYKRFTQENKFNKKNKLHSWEVCRCPEFPGVRIPNCTCKVPGVSPLLQIRWKRLVIDEGHVSASLATILTPFTKLLSVERRWIVTGTPTTNLLGLSLGKKANEKSSVEADDASSDGNEDVSPPEGMDMSIPPSHAGSPSPMVDDDGPPRVWTRYDREDLSKLGKMISHFIAVPRFSAEPKLFTTHIVDPLLDPNGPRPGAIQVLNQVMEMVMIRHRIEDVEEEVVLPPIKQEFVLLDLDPYVVKSYNAMQAAVAINAIDSERKDQDYMFHPRNVEFLQLAVKNMSQLMFWFVDEGLYYVDELTKNAQQHIENAIKRPNTTQEDKILLKEAFKHIKIASEDPLWRAMQDHEDIPYRVSGIRQSIFEAWTRTPQLEPGNYNKFQVGFLHADRLLTMQDMVLRRPLISEEQLIEHAGSVVEKDRLHRQLYKQSLDAKDTKNGKTILVRLDDDDNVNVKAGDAARKAKDPNTLKEMKKALEAALAKLNDFEGDSEDAEEAQRSPFKSSRSSAFHGGEILRRSLLADATLGSTASSKLNYIINEVLQYSPTEKFLIFSDSELSLAHISEALELLHIKFLRFTTQIDTRTREQMVLTFETSETYRVFLMELKHGARGLNLISASRVIFCEPVWQADVESQAIKRAHRIGQTRSISVKTLAIRATAEENMVNRRDVLRVSQQKIPKLIEEAGMRHYIANPKFINHPTERYSTVEVPLLSIAPGDDSDPSVALISESPSLKRVRPGDPAPSGSEVEPPRQKKRAVRFE